MSTDYLPHPIADTYPELTAEEYAALVADIHEHGLIEPIVLYGGRILDGRHRYSAIQDLRERGIDVRPHFTEFAGTEAEAEDYAASRNAHRRHLSYDHRVCRAVLHKLAMPSRWGGDRTQGGDFATLPGKSRDIAAAKFSVGQRVVSEAEELYTDARDLFYSLLKGETNPATGKVWTLREAQRELRDRRKAAENEQAAAAERTLTDELERPVVVCPGEWWRLGDHLLYCGDTGEKRFVNALPPAEFAFADPPYNADKTEWDTGFVWRHDWLIEKAPIVAVTPGIGAIPGFFRQTTLPYQWSMACWIKNGMTRGALGFGNWVLIALFSRDSLHRNAQDHFETTVSPQTTQDTTHPTRKPSGILIHLLNLFTAEGETVIDPFLGSGTTLIAAEVTKRRCVGGEIDPAYCSDIILRWQKHTRRKAEKVSGS